MKNSKEIDPIIIKELLDHSARDGLLFWKFRDRKWFVSDKGFLTWNGKWAGNQGFTSTAVNGYKQGRILRRQYLAHRVIWCLHYGEWPEFQVDHINGCRTDNRIENLRSAVNAENARNRGAQSNNTSGYKGVSFYKSRGNWEANIQVYGKTKRLGYFATPEEAYAAYCKASEELHLEFSRVS